MHKNGYGVCLENIQNAQKQKTPPLATKDAEVIFSKKKWRVIYPPPIYIYYHTLGFPSPNGPLWILPHPKIQKPP